ncbi:MAG: hypothetical protein AAF826_13330 [Pseudomonadota bacterium]
MLSVSMLSACGPAPLQYLDSQNAKTPSDRIFHQTLLEAMPGLQVTPAILGKAVVPSPGYSMQVGRSNFRIPTGPLEEFLMEFEASGAQAATIYFNTKLGGQDGRRVTAKAAFPGCTPGQCRAKASRVKLEYVPKSEWRRFAFSSETSVETIRLAQQEIKGISYFAELTVGYDFKGRVRTFKIISYREPLTAKERAIKRQFGRALKGVPVFQYGRIVPLGVEASTFQPRPNSDIDTRKEI